MKKWMIDKFCIEFDCSYEGVAERALGNKRHEPEFTQEQQVLVMGVLCQEFGFSLKRDVNGFHYKYDTIIQRDNAPGEDPDEFNASWNSIFSGRPVCSNIGYIMNNFGCKYEGSDTQKFCNMLLKENQIKFYKTILEGFDSR